MFTLAQPFYVKISSLDLVSTICFKYNPSNFAQQCTTHHYLHNNSKSKKKVSILLKNLVDMKEKMKFYTEKGMCERV